MPSYPLTELSFRKRACRRVVDISAREATWERFVEWAQSGRMSQSLAYPESKLSAPRLGATDVQDKVWAVQWQYLGSALPADIQV